MKKLLGVIVFVLLAVVVMVSCTGKTGPEGKTGPAGPAGPVGSYSIFFQQGVAPYGAYAGCADAEIMSMSKNGNTGGTYPLVLADSNLGRSLFKFDVSYLPGSTVIVDKAYLILTSTFYHTLAVTNARAYKVTSAWDEGTGTGGQTGDGVTWISRTASAMWVNQGGDYDVTSVGGSVNGPLGITQIAIPVNPQVVQEWIDNPGLNYGIIVICDEASMQYYTKDYFINTLRPKLAVYYRLK